jgi:hypothetical protein
MEEKQKYSFEKRKSINVQLDDGFHKEHDFMEVTEWTNGEGWDICINEKLFSLHFTEFDMLKKMIKKLNK